MNSDDGLSLHFLDLLILIAYLAALVGIGIYHSRKQKDLRDYFLAGREMRWLVVGTSLMAALNSGIDYLMQPSAIIRFGAYTMVGNFSWLLLYPYVFFVTLPLYRRMGIISAYEYLERRFDVRVRLLTAGIFMLWRLGWLATALYVPALALTVATGQPENAWLVIVFLGVVVTIYTMLGGIRAVVWTDLTQFCIMFAGLTATIIVILSNIEGGFGEIIQQWMEVGEESLTELSSKAAGGSFWTKATGYFLIPMTLWGMFIATLVARITTYTSDQVMVQRFQTARTLRDARQGFIITAVSDVVWMLALGFIGLALFAYYKANFGGLPEWAKESPDQLFPYFMAKIFPAGLTGLVIAAILAASLSSIDSALNSLTSVAMVDFYGRLWANRPAEVNQEGEKQQRRQVFISRLFTIGIGFIGIVLACNVAKLGSLLEISNKLINSFTGPILGIYLLGMFTRRAGANSVLVGGLAGFFVTLFVAFQEQIYSLLQIQSEEYISFLWPSTFGFLATFFVGYGASFLIGDSQSEKGRRWNWFSVIKEKLEEEEQT